MTLKPILRVAAKKTKEEAFKESLMKLWKGSDSFVKMNFLLEVLQYLGGWSVKKEESLVPFQRGKIVSTDGGKTEDDVLRSYGERQEKGKGSFVLDKFYPGNITKPGPMPGGSFGYTYDDMVAVEVLNITSPKGKEYAHPVKSEYNNKLKEWLRKETNFLDQISQAIGVDAPAHATSSGVSKSKPRDLNGTGTCPCCFRNIKVKKTGDLYKMVLHGYERPGWGRTEGECIGVGHQPYELSSEGTKEVVSVLEKYLRGTSDKLSQFKADRIDRIADGNQVVKKGDLNWTKVYLEKMRELEDNESKLESDVKSFKKLVSDWKLAELPVEGDKVAPPPRFLTR